MGFAPLLAPFMTEIRRCSTTHTILPSGRIAVFSSSTLSARKAFVLGSSGSTNQVHSRDMRNLLSFFFRSYLNLNLEVLQEYSNFIFRFLIFFIYSIKIFRINFLLIFY